MMLWKCKWKLSDYQEISLTISALNWEQVLKIRSKSVGLIIIVVMITWTSEKPLQKKSLTSQLSGSLIGSNGLINSKFRTWCHSFQPIKEHYLCFVVFCLLFSIIVDPQNQVSNSITTQINNINSKQLSQSQVDPWVIKQFMCEYLMSCSSINTKANFTVHIIITMIISFFSFVHVYQSFIS